MSIITGPKIPVMVSGGLGDAYLSSGNALLRALQSLVQANVKSITNTPPGSPANGDTYVVSSSPTGVWTTKAQNIAYWSTDNPAAPSGEWEFYPPAKGWIVGNQTDGAAYIYSGTSWGLVATRVGAINYTIDGGGSVPSTGAKGQISIPAACTITGWVITADQSGSAVVDVLRSTYAGFPTISSIAGTDKPTLAAQQKNEDTTLTGWGSTALAKGDQIQFSLVSVATCTRLNITLYVTIP